MASPDGGSGAPPPIAGPAAAPPAPPKPDMRGRHPANAFLLYFQSERKNQRTETRQNCSAKMSVIASGCGKRWKKLPWWEKLYYRTQSLQNRLIWKAKLRITQRIWGIQQLSQANNRKQSPKKKKAELARQAAVAEALKTKDAETQPDFSH